MFSACSRRQLVVPCFHSCLGASFCGERQCLGQVEMEIEADLGFRAFQQSENFLAKPYSYSRNRTSYVACLLSWHALSPSAILCQLHQHRHGKHWKPFSQTGLFPHHSNQSHTHTHRQTESKTNIYTHTHKHQTSDCASQRRAAQYATEVHRGPCRRRRYPVLVFRIVSPAYPLPLCNLLLAFSAFPSFGLYGNGHGL